jgi:hypothetical protein
LSQLIQKLGNSDLSIARPLKNLVTAGSVHIISMSRSRSGPPASSDDDAEPMGRPAKRDFKPHKKFTPAEDLLLEEAVALHGDNDWGAVAGLFPGRTTRQCKERWTYYLSPALNHDEWTPEDDAFLLEKENDFGPRWVYIAGFFPNRTDAMVKNRWHMLRRRNARLQKQHARGPRRKGRSAKVIASKRPLTPKPGEPWDPTEEDFRDACSIFASSMDAAAAMITGSDFDWIMG